MTRTTVATAALLVLAGLAAAAPQTFPRYPDLPSGLPWSYTDGPHIVFDVRLETAAFAGSWDCAAPFQGTMVASTAMVCADLGWWYDENGDAYVDADEWDPTCSPGPVDVELTPLTPDEAWGGSGVVVIGGDAGGLPGPLDDYVLDASDGSLGRQVAEGPVTLHLDGCDPAVGYYRSNEQLSFPGDEAYAVKVQGTAGGEKPGSGGTSYEWMRDEDVNYVPLP